METPTADYLDLIDPLRDASRKLVREWGFLRPTVAGAGLSQAAAHCLIEMGDYGRRDFPDLLDLLKVTRSQLGTILAELLSVGHIRPDDPQGAADERRETYYSLTPAGRRVLAAINTYVHNQVYSALAEAPPGTGPDIASAFRLYASALEKIRASSTSVPVVSPALTPCASPVLSSSPFPIPRASVPELNIVPGYLPGILARTLEMHMDYYAPIYGWGAPFEAGFGHSLKTLIERLDQPVNHAWSAVLKTPDSPKPRIVGTIFVNGESCGVGVAKLRAFIVDSEVRGLGAGRKLFNAAMDFIRSVGFTECRLETFRALTVARKLYEGEGFKVVREYWPEGYTKGVQEVEYVWHPTSSSTTL